MLRLITVKVFIFFMFLIYSMTASFAQKGNRLDSLLNRLTKMKEDTSYLKVLDSLCREYIIKNQDFETGMKYAKQAFTLSDKLINNNQSSKNNVLIKRCKITSANIIINIGLYYHIHANYGEAIKNYLEAMKLYEETDYKPGLAIAHNHIGNIYYAENNLTESMNNHLIALNIRTELGDKQGIANSQNNIGIIYEKQGKYTEALSNHLSSLKTNIELNNIRNIGSIYHDIGDVYKDLGNYNEALKSYFDATKYLESIKNFLDIGDSYNGIGEVYYLMGNYPDAISWLNKGLKLSLANNTNNTSRDIFSNLWKVYKKLNDYENALNYYKLYVAMKDTIFQSQSLERIAELKNQIKTDKEEEAAKALQKQKDIIANGELNRQKILLYCFSGGLLIVFSFTSLVFYQKKKITKEKERSDELLLNILPSEIAMELKETGASKAKNYDSVTVLFTDFKDFTSISEDMNPEQLVSEIDYCFWAFDAIIHKYGVEKIKTIGDSYMCAGGLPHENSTHAIDVVKAAIEIRDFMDNLKRKKIANGETPFEIRIGIHSGPVVAGIVGVKKFAYDIWGDTVNLASRMESSGEAGKINISGSTYELVKDKSNCTYRGKIQAKNKGEVDMYFVSNKENL